MKTLNQYITEKILINNNSKFKKTPFLQIINKIFEFGGYDKNDIKEIENNLYQANIYNKTVSKIYYDIPKENTENVLHELETITPDAYFDNINWIVRTNFNSNKSDNKITIFAKQSNDSYKIYDKIIHNVSQQMIYIEITSNQFGTYKFFIHIK